MLNMFRRRNKRSKDADTARKIRVVPKSKAVRKRVPVPVYYQVNGRKKKERWVIESVTHNRKAHIRSLDRPHVSLRRSLDNLVESGMTTLLPA